MAKSVTVGNSGNKNVPTINLGSSGNKKVTEGWIGNSGNQQFFAGLSASPSPSSATSAVDGLRAPDIGNVVVTAAKGKTPRTIAWVRLSGSTDPAISNASSFSVFWTVGSNTGQTAVWEYTVTDAHGTTYVDTVAVTFFT